MHFCIVGKCDYSKHWMCYTHIEQPGYNHCRQRQDLIQPKFAILFIKALIYKA